MADSALGKVAAAASVSVRQMKKRLQSQIFVTRKLKTDNGRYTVKAIAGDGGG